MLIKSPVPGDIARGLHRIVFACPEILSHSYASLDCRTMYIFLLVISATLTDLHINTLLSDV